MAAVGQYRKSSGYFRGSSDTPSKMQRSTAAKCAAPPRSAANSETRQPIPKASGIVTSAGLRSGNHADAPPSSYVVTPIVLTIAVLFGVLG